MSLSPTTVDQTVEHDAASRLRGLDRLLDSPVTVPVGCLAGSAAFIADASSGEADLGLVGVAVMTVALAVTLTQTTRAGVGRPWRTSRLAATTGTAACLFVAAFLSSVGVLERVGPQVTSSAPFAAGVAAMSVVLLVVLPLALVLFACGVSQDRRLDGWMRVLPGALVLVVAVTAVTVAVAGGDPESWLQAAAAAVVGALLTSFSAGLPRAGRSGGSEMQRRGASR